MPRQWTPLCPQKTRCRLQLICHHFLQISKFNAHAPFKRPFGISALWLSTCISLWRAFGCHTNVNLNGVNFEERQAGTIKIVLNIKFDKNRKRRNINCYYKKYKNKAYCIHQGFNYIWWKKLRKSCYCSCYCSVLLEIRIILLCFAFFQILLHGPLLSLSSCITGKLEAK